MRHDTLRRSLSLSSLLLLVACGGEASWKTPATVPVLSDDGKTDQTGRAVVDGGALHFGDELDVALPEGRYMSYRFVATAGTTVTVSALGTSIPDCTESCSSCWDVDTVLALTGPTGGEEEALSLVADDVDGAACVLDAMLGAEIPTTGVYQVLIHDFAFRAGGATVGLACPGGDGCAVSCEAGCPAGALCGDDGWCEPEASVEAPPRGDDGDIIVTRLDVDVEANTGHAEIDVLASSQGRVLLNVTGLEVTSVTGVEEHTLSDGVLDLTIAGGAGAAATVSVDYTYVDRDVLEGATTSGLTQTWPYHCGNLFPCQPDPDEGSRFELSLTGVPEGMTAVYPETIGADAPAYMLAWAISDYRYMEMGTTAAGTTVGMYFPRGYEMQAMTGGGRLHQIFEWYETHLGPYIYGSEVASVSANWGPAAFGGMEHHPFWHVGQSALDSEEINAHEAGHGWFGNGVRIRCWEEFVLSEGLTSYITARAIEDVSGAATAERLWSGYSIRLDSAMRTARTTVAWPDSCGEVDILGDGLFTSIPYMKGAFFMRALEGRVGREALDSVLSGFYMDHRGQAAGMQDLLDAVVAGTGYDPTACADAWLRSEAVPAAAVCGE